MSVEVRLIKFSGDGVTGAGEPPARVPAHNSGLLQEQHVLLNTLISPHTHTLYF